MAFSNKQQLNTMETSVQSLSETKQNILNDLNKNEVSLLKLTATNLYAGIFYYLGQPLEQLLGNKQNLLSKNTDATMRQVSCTDLTVNDSNIVSAINLKQNIIDTTKDVQMRNLSCNSVVAAGTNVITSLNEKQSIINDGDLSIDRTMRLQKSLDDLSDAVDNVAGELDSKQDTLSSSSELSLKSLVVGGGASTQAIEIFPGTSNVGKIQCESLIINTGLNVEETINAQAITIAELQLQVRFGIPIGCISMWSGTTIPLFWIKCDGANGTPNLINKFIKGSNTAGSVGGSATRSLSNANLPSHNHSFSGTTGTEGPHKHWMDTMPYDDKNFTGTGGRDQEYGLMSDQGSYDTNADPNAPGKWTSDKGQHNHSFSGTTSSAGSGSSFSIEPPYFTLIYIMFKGP
jgi:hypothetical protein